MVRHKGRRKRDPNFVVIPFTAALTVGTPTANTVVQAAIVTMADEIAMISVDATWNLRDATTGQGPIMFGFSHGDLSLTEVAEALNAIPVRRDDMIQIERAGRAVRRVGSFQGAVDLEEKFNDGKVTRTPLRGKFRFSEDVAFNMWIQNRSGGTLAGGASVVCDGLIYGRWL